MKDKLNKPNRTTFPIPVPPADVAWNDMRKRLEEEMPKPAAILTSTSISDRIKKLSPLLLLLLFSISTGIGILILTNKSNSKTSTTAVTELENTGKEREEKETPISKTGGQGLAESQSTRTAAHQGTTGEKSIDLINDKAETSSVAEKTGESNSVNGDRRVSRSRPEHSKTRTQKNTTRNSKRKAGKNNKKEPASSPGENVAENIRGLTVTTKDSPEEKKTDLANIRSDKTEKKKDSSVAINIPPPVPEENGWKLKGGLFWAFQLPTAAASDYFTGTNARSQPYRFILPGAWLQAQSDQHLLMFELNPFATSLVPSKPFLTESTIENIPDTTVVTEVTKTLRKQFGISATLGYANNVAGKWWLGGNLQSFWWNAGVAAADGEMRKYPTNGSPFVAAPLNEKYKLEEDEWSYFLKMQLYLNAEANYISKNWQASFRTGIALMPVSKKAGPTNPFRMELQYRLQLFDQRKDKQKKQAGNWSR